MPTHTLENRRERSQHPGGAVTSARLELELSASEERPGEVLAEDVALVLLGVERAVQKAASQLLRREIASTGRPAKMQECAAVLHSIELRERGALLVVEATGDNVEIRSPLAGSELLADTAQRKIIEVVAGAETEFRSTAVALGHMAKRLDIGGRNQSLTLTKGGSASCSAVLDMSAREHLPWLPFGLPLGGEDFWSQLSHEEQAELQGVKEPQDLDDLRMPDVTPEEWAAFYEALGIPR